MDGLTEKSPLTEASESNWRPVAAGVSVVLVVIAVIAWFLRSQPKSAAAPHPYAANLKISDLKMSAAENFVGATVTYLDGNVTNAGDKTVIHTTGEVVFKDDVGQMAQREDVPLLVLQTSGPYPDAVDLRLSPLAPGQSKPFRLTFEHISNDWNRQLPDLQVMDVDVK